ncbi:cupin domain-containing protein [Streptomyces sp. N2-109]|uniref:Cupin domain-containing protein n=1 Tax=Streptomyces gossypii TaxID=2883101 RepID=A0ABT2JMC9_9ACTN|nr:cupin domain-containing protein [Streptomyces gossypii]MCT2588414.1 cupin domain-containing protein [Streptomyces gossypii]
MSTIILPDQRPDGRRGFEIVLSSAVTGGTSALVEAKVDGAMSGPPLHTHPESEETYFVVSGTLLLYIDGEVTELGPSGLAHITRGSQHTWATPVGAGAHFLTLHTPGGYENYHPTALQAERDKGAPLTQEDLFQLAKGFDWELAGEAPLRMTPLGVLVPAGQADKAAEHAVAQEEAAAAASGTVPA